MIQCENLLTYDQQWAFVRFVTIRVSVAKGFSKM